MGEPVSLTIEGQPVRVPSGTLLVEAAKRAGVDIPIFCYHPKLDPVGMCRMCLVEIGRPEKDRQTGDWVRDANGQPVVRFSPKLETACTLPVGEGWVVNVTSPVARQGRREIVEFLLTSHPLDCPICDKGGECPLQELTIDHGPGKSRFLFEDKVDLAKRVPLGDLIFLDRERCIQCARCTRFQEEIVGDPVIGFEQRGRELQIVSYSEPGFDSVFSGNTTDICPVGALTSADFRFQARPWELLASASICPHCPVGCNLMVNVRRQPDADGRVTIQRILPRQNEMVNEIWLCDKGRFGHHFAGSDDRLLQPRVRQGEELVVVDWPTALQAAADGLRGSGASLVALAGGRASNEDLFALRHLCQGLGGGHWLYECMAGGEVTRTWGVAPGTDLGALGPRDAVLVVAADLREEAPIWWLRLKQAAGRGATLITATARPTRLDEHADVTLRYEYGRETETVLRLADEVERAAGGEGVLHSAADRIRQADNLLVFYGGEGQDRKESAELARACARLVQAKGTVGKERNGVLGVWPRPNTQGAWEAGWSTPDGEYTVALKAAGGLILLACDPAGDEPRLAEAVDAAGFVVVMDLFLTETALRADVVFPSASFQEREGTFTSGERRVQRFFPSFLPRGQSRPDWETLGELASALGLDKTGTAAAQVFDRVAPSIPAYSGLTYASLAEVAPQWPAVGGQDLYFGGTAYPNRQGLGKTAHLIPDARLDLPGKQAASARARNLVPIHRLYDRGTTLVPSRLLAAHQAGRTVWVHPDLADRMGASAGDEVELMSNGLAAGARLAVSRDVPPGVILAPRSVGLPFVDPAVVELRRTANGG